MGKGWPTVRAPGGALAALPRHEGKALAVAWGGGGGEVALSGGADSMLRVSVVKGGV